MKKSLIATVLLSGILVLNSCKNDKKAEGENPAETDNQETTTEAAANNAEPKTYTVTATPETVELGKNKEAKVKISNLKAVELSDPEGKSNGIELSYDIELTNKKAIGEGSIYINPSDFRLELDNGNKISHEDYNSVSAEAESSKTSTGNKFRLPAGTKPKALNLFFDETRVSISLNLK